MLNYLWSFMILTGIVYAAFTGRMPDITNAALDSSKEAISLCITMIGVMSFWVGLMEIASKAGIIPAASRKIRPVMIANILGLGWAATPAGLKAMEELSKLEEQRRKHLAPGISRPAGTASNEMCTFLIINISSLQLIPINVIAYRSQYGSVNPASIIGAGIVSTLISTAIAVIYCKLKERSRFQN